MHTAYNYKNQKLTFQAASALTPIQKATEPNSLSFWEENAPHASCCNGNHVHTSFYIYFSNIYSFYGSRGIKFQSKIKFVIKF
jgi:hypothetical protein